MKRIKELFYFFGQSDQKRFIYLLLIIVLTTLVQLFSLSSIIPVFAILGNESLIFENQFINQIYTFLNFKSQVNFKIFIVLCSCALIFVTVIANFLTIYLQSSFTNSIYSKFEINFFNNYLRSSYNSFRKKETSEILLIMNTYLPQFKDMIIGNILNLYTQSIILLFLTVALIFWEPAITLTLIFGMGIFYTIFYLTIKNRKNYISNKLYTISLEKNKYLYDSLNNYKFLQFVNNVDFYLDNFKLASVNYYKIDLKNSTIKSLPRNFLELLLFCGSLLVALIVFLKNQGEIVGSFLTLSIFAIATIKALPACNQIFLNFYTLRIHMPVFYKIMNEKKDLESNLKLTDKFNKKIYFNETINLKKIKFNHLESNFKLEDISLEIKKNSIIGIMGKSGSGKTTLIDILSGLYEMDEGTFSVDNKELNYDEINLFRKSFSYVPQEIFLVNGSIKQNIAIATNQENINMKLLIESCKKAEIYDYVMSLENKFETNVGEQGYKLSGGQKQRLGIARALYQKPKIIIFDESTSALDYITEKSFLKTMRNLKNELTCIFVSHKIQAMNICDKIFYLQDGKIICTGDYSTIKDKFF
jgi:ABC-type bacteriocin/lantibiotic exporter with double-glycine peptidase domain